MALWTNLAEWRGPTPNQGPAMAEQRGLVVHIAVGYYEGTIAWQRNPDANVSSHFVVAGPLDLAQSGDADGKLAQMVDTNTAAWTQRSGNGHWLSIECSGFTPNPLSPAQVESIAQIYARGVRDLKWPLQLAGNPDGRGLGYHSMGTPANGWHGPTWGHEQCPGPAIIAQLPAILDRARQILGGTPAPTRRHDMAYQLIAPGGSVYVVDGFDPTSRKPYLYAQSGPDAWDLCLRWQDAGMPVVTAKQPLNPADWDGDGPDAPTLVLSEEQMAQLLGEVSTAAAAGAAAGAPTHDELVAAANEAEDN